MWLTVTKSNNHPEIIANFYLNCVAELGGCPVKLRTDCGTENGMMAAMQCTFQEDTEAHKHGYLHRTKGLRASGCFTEETGLVGG